MACTCRCGNQMIMSVLCFDVMSHTFPELSLLILTFSLSLSGGGQIQSSAISLAAIFEKVRLSASAVPTHPPTTTASTPAVSIDLPTLKRLLEFMRFDAVGVVSKVPSTDMNPQGASYLVNMDTVMKYVKRRTIHSIVSEKYGEESGRIVELLLRKKYLDQSKIGDLAILPAREARERVYQLFRGKWLDYVEVSKRMDFSASTSVYLWFVDTMKLETQLVDNICQGLLNVRVRRRREFLLGKDIVDFASQITTEVEAKKYEKLSRVLNLLDKSILSVAETLLILSKL